MRIQVAKHQIRIGHSRLITALTITDGSRFCAGAVRPNTQGTSRVDPGNTAATGTDFGEVDYRHTNRVT